MATRVFRAAAAPVAQVETITITGPVVAGENWTVTINGRSVTFEATAGTTANVAAGLVAALNASTLPEFAEITWADANPDVVGTCDTAGLPFTISVSTDSAGGSIATATTGAATGPQHWSDANNWSGATVPINGDTAIVDLSLGSVLYGLAQSAVTLAELRITSASFTGHSIGLPARSDRGYAEYRDQYLAIGATACVIDSGSGRVKINFGTAQTAVEIRRTGSPVEQGVPAVLLRGTHASNAVEAQRGSVGLAFEGGTSFTATTLLVNSDATVRCGAGCSIATLASTGDVELQTNVTTATIRGGDARIVEDATVGTMTVDGPTARVLYDSSGTATTVTCGPGIIDCSGDLSPRTFTTTTLRAGGRIVDPHDTITFTNGIALASDVDTVICE